MKFLLLGVLVLGYAASGLFVVAGNEQAVVRICGKLQTEENGDAVLLSSGLHYAPPWPFSRVDRVNLHEVRTISLGLETETPGDYLQSLSEDRRNQFLTGDKNLLHLQLSIQYRVARIGVRDFLFSSAQLEDRLRLLVESITTDLVRQSGVDYVHFLGLEELRVQLTRQTQEQAAGLNLGVEVEEVTIQDVQPPLAVKADFLDVSNARADKQQYINSANSYAQQQESLARAEARRILNLASAHRQDVLATAHSRSASFRELLAQLNDSPGSVQPNGAAKRRLVMERAYLEMMEQVFRQVKRKVVLDTDQPVDLTLPGRTSENKRQ